MPASIATLLALCAAALGVTALVTWLLTRWWYGRRVVDLRTRAKQSEQTLRDKQTALLGQVDALRKELREQRALVASLSAKSAPAAAPTPQQQVESLLSEPFITSRAPRKPVDFEDTQIL